MRDDCGFIACGLAEKAEQLGEGVRGKYHRQVMAGSNIAIISAENARAFPTSDAVNAALSTLLEFTRNAQALVQGNRGKPRRRSA